MPKKRKPMTEEELKEMHCPYPPEPPLQHEEEEPPTEQQLEYIRRIIGTNGLMACSIPKTRREANQVIMSFLGHMRRQDYSVLSPDKLVVEEKDGKIDYGYKGESNDD